jgi:hypothetical protein
MPIRNTTHILKNSDIVNRPLPSTLLKGEPIVNTAEGIVYFSGVTTSTSEWTPAGTGTTSNFFEVGSNLYDLKLRNRILSYNGLSNLSGKFLSGTTNGFVLADISSIVSVDTYVTGFTYDNANNYTISRNLGQPPLSINVSVMTGLTVTGTISASTIDATNILSGGTNLATLINSNDTYATGYTYTPSTNTFLITGNNGFNPLSSTINSVSGLSVSNLTAGRVVYVGASGLLSDEAGFTYDSSTNVFSVPSDGAVNVGTGGLNVTGNAVIQGTLTVFGSAISAFTTELYVEDPNITLNYNPTGSTIATSLGSGISIQDGNGITNGTVNLNINRLDSLTGLTINNIPDVSEYVASTGYANRGWITQLNDIVIRSTNVNTPNGVRVLAEFDILDGGTF